MSRLDDIAVGDRLDTLEKTITRPQMFRYGAITWNPRMIHFDPEYTKKVEGHPDILIHATLHGASIQELLMDWVGDDGVLEDLSYRNVDVGVPEVPLYAEAKITEINEDTGRVSFDVRTHQEGTTCAEGSATVRLTVD